MVYPSGGTGIDSPDRAAADLALLAFSQTAFAAIITDAIGTITYVNDAFVSLTGYAREEAVGQKMDLLRCDVHNDAFYTSIRQRLRAGEVLSDRITVGRKDGSHYRSRTVAAPLRGDDGAIVGFSFFSSDTSDEARLEAQLGQMQKMEAIGEMASGIAHEINTPIQYVGDNIQFLRDASNDVFRLIEAYEAACENGPEAPLAKDRLAAIETIRGEIDWDFLKEEIPLAIEQALEGRDRVAAIVRAMKEFAHPGTEELTPVDVNHAIENTLVVSRGEWKHIADVVRELDPALPPVPCLPGAFNQVLLNLVVNAGHAIAESRDLRGGEKGVITLVSRLHGNDVEVLIRDTGCGIPPEVISRIFEPFYTTKDVGKGTGQGLALAHAVIVDQLKGQIEVESTPGVGTQFLLRLPLDYATVAEI